MRLRNLDVLRACLALMVLIGHARMMLWMPWHEWQLLPHSAPIHLLGLALGVFRYGGEAVVVFFALSGYFIHLRVAQQAARGVVKFGAVDYLKRRARRIVPPYYAVLVLTVLLDVFAEHWWPRLFAAQTGDVMLDANMVARGYSMTAVLPALLLQPKLLGMHFGSNGPLWSIGNEVFYYALYPVFMLLWQRSRWLAYGAGFMAGGLAWSIGIGGLWSGMLASYPVWLGGALLAEWSAAHPLMIRRREWFWCSLVVTLLAFAASHRESLKLVPILMLMGVGAVAAMEAMPVKLLEWCWVRGLEWLGVRSYSVYIAHFPVLMFISAWCFQTMGARPAAGWLALGGAVISLGVSLGFFHLVERRWLPRRAAAGSPAVVN